MAESLTEVSLDLVIGDLQRLSDVSSKFQKQAFDRAIEVLHSKTDAEIRDLDSAELIKIPRIGAGIANYIRAIYEQGFSTVIEDIALPRGCNFLQLRGIGPAKAKKLLSKYNVNTIEELAEVLPESEDGSKLQKAITFFLESSDRQPWMALAAELVVNVTKAFQEKDVEIITAGSFRRFASTVGDIDFVLRECTTAKAEECLRELYPTIEIEAKGGEKLLCTLPIGDQVIHADFVCPTAENFGSTLNYLTGSRDFNVSLRQRAKDLGLKLNEHGLFDADGNKTALPNEEDLFTALKIPYVEPPMRHMSTYEKTSAVNFISKQTMKLSMHNHTTCSDGFLTPQQLFELHTKDGATIFGISDHSQPNPNGVRDLKEYRQHLEPLRQKGLLVGIEAEVLTNGIKDELVEAVKENCDYVILACHINHSKNVVERLLDAIEKLSPMPIILAHVTGRVIGYREEAQIASLEVFEKFPNVIIEINSHLERLDPPTRLLQTWNGPVVISTDLHEASHVKNYEYGIWQSWKGLVDESQIHAAEKILKPLMPII